MSYDSVYKDSDDNAPDPVIPRALTKIKGKILKEEIAGWLAEGKAKGAGIRAELAKDPAWRIRQALCGVPEYKHLAVGLTDESRGKSPIPEDPEEKRSWARDKSVQNGWIEARVPGQEG